MESADYSVNSVRHFLFTECQIAVLLHCLERTTATRNHCTKLTSSKIDTMTLPEYALAYDNCTLDELRNDIKEISYKSV